jgi:hypothetical protein
VAGHIGGRFKREAGSFAAPSHGATPELANGHGSGAHARSVLQAAERNAE